MAINFPNSPSNGDTHTAGGKTFTYDATAGVWNPASSAASIDELTDVDTSTSAPSTNDLLKWNGTNWVPGTTTGTEPPVILTEPPTTVQSLNSDGTTSTVTMTAQDPDGFDITYGIAYKTAGNALPDQLASATTIDQSTGVYTFTPSTTTSDAGSFRARLSASDGVSFTTRLVDFSLSFFAGSYLVAGNGTQVVGTGGGTTVTNASTATDSALNYDAGVIDANGELILFTGMPAFSLTPTSGTDNMLVYAVKYDGASGASIGYSAVDDNSYNTGSLTLNSTSIGWGLGTASTYYASSPALSIGRWYIVAITSTGTGNTNFSSRIYDVTNQTFSTVTAGSGSGYALPYLPTNGTYDNHMAFFGGSAPSPITGYTSRSTMEHRVGGVAVMPYDSSTVDASILSFKSMMFT